MPEPADGDRLDPAAALGQALLARGALGGDERLLLRRRREHLERADRDARLSAHQRVGPGEQRELVLERDAEGIDLAAGRRSEPRAGASGASGALGARGLGVGERQRPRQRVLAGGPVCTRARRRSPRLRPRARVPRCPPPRAIGLGQLSVAQGHLLDGGRPTCRASA